MEKKQPIIELKHIKKCYTKDVPVIYDFNLTINEGEFVTFLGPSGCGKTTILRMLAGFETPTSGEILFNGKDISELPPNERKFNTVFQKYALFPHMTVKENILYGLKVHKVPKVEMKERLSQVLEMLDLKGLEERKPKELSGGQRQRLTLARALVPQSDILIMDDSASALDYATDARLRKAIQDMKRKPTVFIVSQRTSSIQNADMILVLDDGKIAGQGTHEQLLKSCNIYREIYETQFKKEEA